MSAGALLSELRRRDIQLAAVGSELRCSAPAGALTPELREQLRQHKADLLALLASAQAVSEQPRAIVPLQPGGSRTPIFGVPGHNGDVFCYRPLVCALGEDQPFFGLQPPGLDGEAEPLERVEDLAAYLAAQIRAFRPGDASIVLAGFCAGGTVAFELAQQLRGSGAKVELLALFGCPHPVYFSRRRQLALRLVHELERVRKHALGLASKPSGWRAYLAEELRERKARQETARTSAVDPVLALRSKVEEATLRGVRRYVPRPFAGRCALFLPGREWQRSGVSARRWGGLARGTEQYVGPDASTGADMLREAHAQAFAELFNRCIGPAVGTRLTRL